MQFEIRGTENLSFRERQVVALKEIGKSNEEVAKQLDISPSTVATLYHRAKNKGYQVVIVIPAQAMGLFNNNPEED